MVGVSPDRGLVMKTIAGSVGREQPSNRSMAVIGASSEQHRRRKRTWEWSDSLRRRFRWLSGRLVTEVPRFEDEQGAEDQQEGAGAHGPAGGPLACRPG